MHFVPFCLVAEHIRVGGAELRLVERITETLAALLHLLVVLLFQFCQIILDQDVCTVSFLGILVVDQRVVEGSYVAGSLPDAGVHKDGGVDSHDIVVQVNHRFPPVFLDVVLHLHAVLAVVIDSAQAVVDLAGGENESVFLGVRHQILKGFFLCHRLLRCFISSNNVRTKGRVQTCGWGIASRSVCISKSLNISISISIVRFS